MRHLSSLLAFFFLSLAIIVAVPACTTEGDATSSAPTDPSNEDAGTGDPGDPGDPGTPPSGGACGACKSGCCYEGACRALPSPMFCGKGGAACVDCTAGKTNHGCIGGVCGCSLSSDCAKGEVCNPDTHQCGQGCSTQPCASGCCSANGVCQAGSTASACGTSGSCLDCSTSGDGKTCVAGGKCGCNSSADCGTYYACDLSTHKCTNACSDSQPCNGGCCGGGTCKGGSSTTACGDTGGACTDCSGNPEGQDVCAYTSKGGTCGCQQTSDCPTNHSCDTKTHTCGTACSPTTAGPLYCNRGCCDPVTLQCSTGTTAAACGDAPSGYVAMCTKCGTFTSGGPQCLGGTHCGCSGASDCPGRTCGAGGKCCDAKGASCSTGGTCCSGVCAGFGGSETCQ